MYYDFLEKIEERKRKCLALGVNITYIELITEYIEENVGFIDDDDIKSIATEIKNDKTFMDKIRKESQINNSIRTEEELLIQKLLF